MWSLSDTIFTLREGETRRRDKRKVRVSKRKTRWWKEKEGKPAEWEMRAREVKGGEESMSPARRLIPDNKGWVLTSIST